MRKRRTKYHWLLNSGTTGPAANGADDSSAIDIAFTVPANGTTAGFIRAILEDTPSDDFTVDQPIGVAQNNDYFVKRIVGKIFLGVSQEAQNTVPQVFVGAGLFVARAGDADDAAGAELLPIGDPADQMNNYSPLRNENIREPWIWRRTWVLSNENAGGLLFQPAIFPQTTAGYGSVADGPHVDAKTARRVRDGERLFLVVAARNHRLNTVNEVDTIVSGTFDYRVLGQLRKARNRSVF